MITRYEEMQIEKSFIEKEDTEYVQERLSVGDPHKSQSIPAPLGS